MGSSSSSPSDKAILKVILDTNFLLVPFQFNIDVKEEIAKMIDRKYELCTTDGVLQELESLTKDRNRYPARSATDAATKGRSQNRRKLKRNLKHLKLLKCALSFASDMTVLKTGVKDVDAALVSLASQENIVCTNDKVLKEKIRKKGAPVIFMRQKRYLAVDGYIK